MEVSKTCEECGYQFFANDKRKRFCKRSCSAAYNNRKRGGIPLKDCKGVCGRKIQKRGNQEYCSTQCRRNRLMSLWFEGEWVPTTQEFPAWLREILIIGGCSLCKWSEVNPFTGKSTCQIDHKNGNASDHSFNNIQVLCPNCHSLTHNYGALNKGNGRKHRYSA